MTDDLRTVVARVEQAMRVGAERGNNTYLLRTAMLRFADQLRAALEAEQPSRAIRKGYPSGAEKYRR